MNVLIRADSSTSIGSGHLMRCLTLASQLRDNGLHVSFAVRQLPGAMVELIRSNDFRCFVFPESREDDFSQQADAAETIRVLQEAYPDRCDLIIVDHYQLGLAWETLVRPYTRKLMVIDDLAERPHDCDILLDQNYYPDADNRYANLVPKHCKKLIGPAYLLLRSEFVKTREKLRKRDGNIRKILIFLGAGDPTNQTTNAITAIRELDHHDLETDVVVGQANPHKQQIEALCKTSLNIRYHCQISNMAELINNADLAIGAGGAAMWERCYLGLPTITVVFAHNQLRASEDAFKAGAIEYIGWAHTLGANDYKKAIKKLLDAPKRVKKISETALKLVTPTQAGLLDAILFSLNESFTIQS